MTPVPTIPNPDSLGGRIRLRRMALKMHQADLALAAGLSPAVMSAIELGRHSPRVIVLERIAQILGLPAAELLGGSVGGSAPSSSTSSSGTGILPVSYPFSLKTDGQDAHPTTKPIRTSSQAVSA
jgi:transcriptional regulator with XRE-family HTH domain